MDGEGIRTYTKRGKLIKQKKVKKPKGVGPRTIVTKVEVIPKNEIVEPPKRRGRPPKISIVLPPDEPPPPPKQKKGTYTRLTPGEDWRPGTFETLKEYNERQARRLGPGFKKAIDGFNALQKEFKRKRLVKLSKLSSSNITPEEVEKAISTEQMNKLYIQNLAGVDIDKLKKQGVEVDTNEVLAELGKTAKKPKKPKSSRSKSLERKEPRAERSSVEALDLAPQPKKRGRPKKEKSLSPLAVPTLERTSSSSKKSPRTPKEDLPSPRGQKPPPEIPLPPPPPTAPAKKRPPMPKGIAKITPVEAKKEKLLEKIKEDAPTALVPLVNEVIQLDKQDEKDHDDETTRYAKLLQATQGYELDLSNFGRSKSRASTSRARPSGKNEKLTEQLREKSKSMARSEGVDTLALTIAEREIVKALRDIVLEVEQRDRDEQFKEAQKILDEANAYQALLRQGKKLEAVKAIKKIGGVLIKSLKKAKIDADQIEQLQKANKQYNDATKIQSVYRAKQAKETKESLQEEKQAEAKSYLKARLEEAKSVKEAKKLENKREQVKKAKELRDAQLALKKSKEIRLGGLTQPEKVRVRAERTTLSTFIDKRREEIKAEKEAEKELERIAEEAEQLEKLKKDADKAQAKAKAYTELQEASASKASEEEVSKTSGKKVPKYAKKRREEIEAEQQRAEKLQREAEEARAAVVAAELEAETKAREAAEERAQQKAKEAQQAFITRKNELKTQREQAEKEEAERAQAEREAEREKIQRKAEQSAEEAKKALADKRRQERENPELVKAKREAEAERIAKLKKEREEREKFEEEKKQIVSFLKQKRTLVKAYYETTPEIAERIDKYLQRLGINSISEFVKLPEELKEVITPYVKQKLSYEKPDEDLGEIKKDVKRYYLEQKQEAKEQTEFEKQTKEDLQLYEKQRQERKKQAAALSAEELKEQSRRERREIEKELAKIYGENKITLTPEQRTEYEKFKKMKTMNENEKRQAKFNVIARTIYNSGNVEALLAEEREKISKKKKTLLVPKTPTTQEKLKAEAEAKAKKAKEEEDEYGFPLPKTFLRRLPKAVTEEVEEELTEEQKAEQTRAEAKAETEQTRAEAKEREIELSKKAAEKLAKSTGKGLPYRRCVGMGDLSDGDISSEDDGGSDQIKKKISHKYIMPSSPMLRRGFQHPAMCGPSDHLHPNAYANIHAMTGGLLKQDLQEGYEKAVPKALRPAVEELAKDTGMYAMRSKPVQKAKRQAERVYKKAVPKSLRPAVEDLGKDMLAFGKRRAGYGKGMSRSRSSSPSFSPERGGMLGCGSMKEKLSKMYKKAVPKSLRPAVAELAGDTAAFAMRSKPVKKLRSKAKETYEKAVPKSLRPAVEELAKDSGAYAMRQSGFGLKKGSEEARKFMAALRARKGKKSSKGGKIPAPPSRSPVTDPSLL
jgi:hypothetical protein